MTIRKLAELTDRLARNQRLLGLDLGEKTIGLALSDVTLMIASPMESIRRGKFTRASAMVISVNAVIIR